MQERVVGFFKDVWETLKRELKGPEVKSMMTGPSITEVKDKNFTNLKNPIIREIDKKINISDLNDNLKEIEIESGLFEKKSMNIKLFNDIFSMTEKSITLNSIKIDIYEVAISKNGVKTNKIEIEKTKINIIKASLETIKTNLGKYKFEWKYNIKNGTNLIFEMPKRIKGKKEDDFSREEFLKIMSRLKRKMIGKDIQNYKIESIFHTIPIKCVKNIKYFIDKNEIEVYFKNGNSGESADFVIMRNKITGLIEKIFI